MRRTIGLDTKVSIGVKIARLDLIMQAKQVVAMLEVSDCQTSIDAILPGWFMISVFVVHFTVELLLQIPAWHPKNSTVQASPPRFQCTLMVVARNQHIGNCVHPSLESNQLQSSCNNWLVVNLTA